MELIAAVDGIRVATPVPATINRSVFYTCTYLSGGTSLPTSYSIYHVRHKSPVQLLVITLVLAPASRYHESASEKAWGSIN
jgi:hypothetical protein